MFARGKSRDSELSTVGRFFAKGSTLERATAFTKSAATHDRNALSASSKTTAEELGSSKEHPVQEMEFFNIGGAKVFYYYGLDISRSPEHVLGAGPHVRDTAVVDQYKIHERPGECSSVYHISYCRMYANETQISNLKLHLSPYWRPVKPSYILALPGE